MTLPIEGIRSRFDEAMAARNRLVVTAETGAGKSTRVPLWLSDLWLSDPRRSDPRRSDGSSGLVLVVEPRRVACESLANYLASERGEKVGQSIGSRVRFSDRSSAATRILFCTPGIALRVMAPGRDAPPLAALVVDEFHERSWQMDLIVAAAASLPAWRDVPLVLTSATLDAEAAAAVLDAATLHATGRTFPVDIRFDANTPAPTERDLARRMADAVLRTMAQQQGDVLAFLPGMRDIRATEAALGRIDAEVLPVHGSLPPEAMARVFQSGSKRRRVYLATNVAETSITLPGVRIVIDSGLAKTRLHRAGRTVLATAPISAASMEQRAGRAGRVAAGNCLRLWSERHRPEPYQRPEIERVELDDLMLQGAELGLSGQAWRDAKWITPPPEFAVERARARLADLQAMDGDRLTERGRRLAQLPVSAEEAALLVGAPDELAGPLCDLVAILQGRGSLLRDLRDVTPAKRDAVREAREELLGGVSDEVTMHLLLVRQGHADKHHLSGRRLREARAISKQLRDLVGAKATTGKVAASAAAHRDHLARYILERLPAAGFVRRQRADRQNSKARSEPWANGTIEVQVYPFEAVDPEVTAPKPRAGVILETDWVAGAGGVTGIGRMLLPTEPQVLAAAGLGERTLAKVSLQKKGAKVAISAVLEVQLAGVPLRSGETELRGTDLHRAVAGFVLENRLFRGAGDAIADALHGWAVLAGWDGEPLDDYEPGASPAGDAASWLTEKLGSLGVEAAEDLQLLNADDLVPNLEQETGIPEWAFAPLLKGFPRRWRYLDGTYSCTVQHGQRTVLLEPIDSKARKLKEPPAGALPRFFGFRVDYQQGSRRLRLR